MGYIAKRGVDELCVRYGMALKVERGTGVVASREYFTVTRFLLASRRDGKRVLILVRAAFE